MLGAKFFFREFGQWTPWSHLLVSVQVERRRQGKELQRATACWYCRRPPHQMLHLGVVAHCKILRQDRLSFPHLDLAMSFALSRSYATSAQPLAESFHRIDESGSPRRASQDFATPRHTSLSLFSRCVPIQDEKWEQVNFISLSGGGCRLMTLSKIPRYSMRSQPWTHAIMNIVRFQGRVGPKPTETSLLARTRPTKRWTG